MLMCEHCGKLVQGRSMRAHLIIMHMWGVFSCTVCKHVVFNPDDIAHHILDVHKDLIEEGSPAKARCPSCKEDVLLEDGAATLKKHYIVCSKRSKGYGQKVVCELCGKSVNSNRIKAHKNMHMLDKTIKCEFQGCDKYFRTKEELKRHEETHNLKYICNICGHKTNKNSYLQQHVQLVHQKKSFDVKCTECDLVFIDHSRMLKHRNLVHFPDKYRCSVCQKSFATKTLMTRHMAVHDAEGHFECEVCGRKLKKAEALKEHMRIHTGERPFACQYCSFKAISSGVLCRHKQKDHPQQWEEREKHAKKVKVSTQQQQQDHPQQQQALLDEAVGQIVHELDKSSSQATSSPPPTPGTSSTSRPRPGRKRKARKWLE